MDTRTYAHGLFQKTAAVAATQETLALRRLAALADTSAAGSGDEPLAPCFEPESLGAGAGRSAENGHLSQYEFRSGTDHHALFLFNSIAEDRGRNRGSDGLGRGRGLGSREARGDLLLGRRPARERRAGPGAGARRVLGPRLRAHRLPGEPRGTGLRRRTSRKKSAVPRRRPRLPTLPGSSGWATPAPTPSPSAAPRVSRTNCRSSTSTPRPAASGSSWKRNPVSRQWLPRDVRRPCSSSRSSGHVP